ncbi:MAG TPA: AarF/UbiB family protein [Anaerolineales bacterium]|nr:AarF/UbiB family protein [Anaerolineales bacterium]
MQLLRKRLRGRYFRILYFFAGVILRFILWELLIARVGLRSWTRRTRAERFRREAVRFRALAIHMGGVMIKVGQFLSSRLDVLPPEVTDELANLQDEVPAEPYEAIQELAEKELGAPLMEKFEWLDADPLAAASLGQVHRARLKPVLNRRVVTEGSVETDAEGAEDEAEGFRNVVVKIQRPSIEMIVEVDLAALRRVGNWLMRYRPVREHADVPALLREFSATVREEIDYVHEAGNAETFFENFKDDPDVHVPRIVRSLSTLRVLTLEDVYAIKITDYASITAVGIDRGDVAKRLFDTYLKQIFEDGFVHADPHPGNLFVTPLEADGESARRWQLTFVDFGMTARVPEGVRDGLREMLIGVGTRDSSRLITAYQRLGMLLPGADLKLIEQAEAQVFDRFWGMSMSELRKTDPAELRKFAHQYRDLIFSMPFQVPNNLILLGRTMAILSGMCTGLDPDFNLWNQLAPYARKLIAQEAKAGIGDWLEELGRMFQSVIALPSQTSRVLTIMERGDLIVQSPQMSREMRALTRAMDRLTTGVIFFGLLMGGVLLYNAGSIAYGQWMLAGAFVALIWILFLRSR